MQRKVPLSETAAGVASDAKSGSTLPALIGAFSAANARHFNTPLVPTNADWQTRTFATLTLLSGPHGGRVVAVDGPGVVIGCAAETGFVIDEPGVSRLHARVARTPGGFFYVEDLGSTSGTFIGTSRIGISLLRSEEVIRLGPHILVRFALVN